MLFEVHLLHRFSTTTVFVYVGIVNLFCHISFSLVFFVLPISRCKYKRFLVLGHTWNHHFTCKHSHCFVGEICWCNYLTITFCLNCMAMLKHLNYRLSLFCKPSTKCHGSHRFALYMPTSQLPSLTHCHPSTKMSFTIIFPGILVGMFLCSSYFF